MILLTKRQTANSKIIIKIHRNVNVKYHHTLIYIYTTKYRDIYTYMYLKNKTLNRSHKIKRNSNNKGTKL